MLVVVCFCEPNQTFVPPYFGQDEIPQFDFHWSQKIDTAVWRGALTGQKRDGFSIRDIPMLSPKELCLEMHRCRLVLQTARTELVNAKLVGLPGKTDLIPSEIDGTKLYGEKLSYSEMLQHKAIIMLEGNGTYGELCMLGLIENSVSKLSTLIQMSRRVLNGLFTAIQL